MRIIGTQAVNVVADKKYKLWILETILKCWHDENKQSGETDYRPRAKTELPNFYIA